MHTFSVCPTDWSREHPVDKAINIIQAAFAHVTINPPEGARRANAILNQLRALKAPPVVQDVYLKGASQAVMVDVQVSPNDVPVSFMMMPGEGIQLNCPDGQEKIATALADALGYECEEIG